MSGGAKKIRVRGENGFSDDYYTLGSAEFDIENYGPLNEELVLYGVSKIRRYRDGELISTEPYRYIPREA